MSGCCERLPICVAGNSFNAFISYNSNGDFLSGYYLDTNLVRQALTPGSFAWGACLVPSRDVKRIDQGLVAGANVISHGMNAEPGTFPTEVDVFNNLTNDRIALRVTGYTANTVTLFVPVAVPNVRIMLDV
jgi:hypothetical protein